MDRKLLDYLPTVVRSLAEFKGICEGCEPEISAAWDALERLLNNQFLETADEVGVTLWETELGIQAKDSDTLYERKMLIKYRWAVQLPYTRFWLMNWLAGICGEGNYDLDIEDYIVRIVVRCELGERTASILSEIMSTLAEVLPANLWLSQVSLRVQSKQSTALHIGGAAGAIQRMFLPAREDDIVLTHTGRIGVNGIMNRTMPLPELS